MKQIWKVKKEDNTCNTDVECEKCKELLSKHSRRDQPKGREEEVQYVDKDIWAIWTFYL